MERGLSREQDYDAERAERIRGAGLSRRLLLWAGGAAIGAAAVTGSLGSWPAFHGACASALSDLVLWAG